MKKSLILSILISPCVLMGVVEWDKPTQLNIECAAYNLHLNQKIVEAEDAISIMSKSNDSMDICFKYYWMGRLEAYKDAKLNLRRLTSEAVNRDFDDLRDQNPEEFDRFFSLTK